MKNKFCIIVLAICFSASLITIYFHDFLFGTKSISMEKESIDTITTGDFKLSFELVLVYKLNYVEYQTLTSQKNSYTGIRFYTKTYSIEQPDAERTRFHPVNPDLKLPNSPEILTTDGQKRRKDFEGIRPGKFHFPSGRFFKAGDDIYLVLFAHDKCNLYKNSNENDEFVIANEKGLKKELAKLWDTSFSPDDVSWNFCLVKNCDFFGVNCKKPFDENKNYWNIDLYNEYMQIKSEHKNRN